MYQSLSNGFQHAIVGDTMKIKLAGVILALGGVLVSSQASAGLSNIVFEYTYSPYQTGTQQLILNGGAITLNATSTGWYDQTGSHGSTNPDYVAGTCGSSDACFGTDLEYNDYFVFDLSNVATHITSAELSLYNPSDPPAPGGGFLSSQPLTYTNFDVDTPVTDLIADQTGAIAIYNDLGSGTVYAQTVVTGADNGTQIVIPLNANGLTALNEAEGSPFAIGGSVTSAVPTGGIPEPAIWAMLLVGFMGLGVVARSRGVVAV